ncbi:hypothetical protein evm_005914 [Chilo suppressalis]|nr:hypothetical protein evm_005914 [Chilo suppressalis]
MCYNGKCFGCIRVETGSMIYAVFNAVMSILSVIGNIIVILMYYSKTHSYKYRAEFGDIEDATNNFDDLSVKIGDNGISTGQSDNEPMIGDYFVYTLCGVLIGVGLLNFFFAVILCNGVKKRNSGQIMGYLIFGVVKAVLSSIVFLVICGSEALPVLGLFILAIPFVVYCFILHMIRMTMDKFTSEKIYGFHHTRFDDTTQIIKP